MKLDTHAHGPLIQTRFFAQTINGNRHFWQLTARHNGEVVSNSRLKEKK